MAGRRTCYALERPILWLDVCVARAECVCLSRGWGKGLISRICPANDYVQPRNGTGGIIELPKLPPEQTDLHEKAKT